jgi:hypothetical protein
MMNNLIAEIRESYSSYEFSDGNSHGETYYSIELEGTKLKVTLDDNKIIGDFICELDNIRLCNFKQEVSVASKQNLI